MTATKPESTAASDAPGRDPLLAQALRRLEGRLRFPDGPGEGAWAAVSDDGTETFDLNALLPLAAVWAPRRPEVAVALVDAALDACDEYGVPPRYTGPSAPTAPGAAWPLLAQAALRAAGSEPDPGIDARAVEGLRRALGAAVHLYDPEGVGRPRWPTPEEAFVPDAWDENLAPVDLAAFLRAEFEAFDLLCRRSGIEPDDDHRVPPGYRERLDHHLLRVLWDPRRGRFTDRYLDGRRSARLTLGALTPLLWTGLPDEHREAVRGLARAGSPLWTPAGLALWEPWPEDPVPPPTPSLPLAVALCALDRVPAEFRDVAAAVRPALEGAFADPAKAEPPPALSVLAALSETGPEPDRTGRSRWIRWLDRHSRPLLRIAGALLVLIALGLLLLPRLFPHTGEGPTIEALAGLAENHYHHGRYEDAEALYREILRRRSIPLAHFRLGNAAFRRGALAEAEAQYREAMRQRDLEPQALFNLAQVLLRKERVDEAREAFQRIVAEHGARYPDIVERAETALRILDRGPPHGPPPAPAPGG